ncbi:efflux transporter outer membrane subunit [Halomonas organivorans]|uniref:NodT family efflux transporter outer membrane factor (OMF) lipoprotein n=1 Tax=Halomonas organivorans TaxID=257772 RepID=A0A7W5G4C6_9GAMM|nr:efflux transporter outer membrane subunit [Halomonas organivorans]MBB3139805.1 NodT family efflux transporter outer membrane factor (OMF) lipoprotein [Halomonas organivorans]
MTSMNRTVALLLAASLLSGCAMSSGLSAPASEPPAQWLNQQRASQAMVHHPRWWTQFGSAELDRLVRRALEANTDLQAATARIEQADAQLTQAGASLFPTLGLSTGASRSGTIGAGGTTEGYSANLNASYELDLWGALRNNRDAAKASLLASRFARDTVQLTVLASVVNTYLQVRYLQDSLILTEDNLRLAERLLEQVRAKVENGAVSPQDLAQQRTVVANARAQLPDLRQQLRQSRYALAVLVGETPQGFTVDGGELESLTLPDIQAGLPDQVLAQRPDIAQAQASLMAADRQVAIARADYWPSITLTGSGGYSSSDLSSLLSGDALYNLALSLPQTLFDGGARSARVDQATAAWEEQRAGYVGTLLTALQEVEQSLGSVQALAAQQQYRDEAYQQAQEAYRIARVRYREGATELTDVLNAQSSFNSARQNRLDLAYSQYQSRVTLYRVLGEGGEARADEVLAPNA